MPNRKWHNVTRSIFDASPFPKPVRRVRYIIHGFSTFEYLPYAGRTPDYGAACQVLADLRRR